MLIVHIRHPDSCLIPFPSACPIPHVSTAHLSTSWACTPSDIWCSHKASTQCGFPTPHLPVPSASTALLFLIPNKAQCLLLLFSAARHPTLLVTAASLLGCLRSFWISFTTGTQCCWCCDYFTTDLIDSSVAYKRVEKLRIN